MHVDRLPFVVVGGIQLPEGPGDRLGGLVGLEAQIQLLFAPGGLGVAQTTVAEHQVVVRLQILGIDRDHTLQEIDRVPVLTLQEEDACLLIQHHAIAWILRFRGAQMFEGFVVAAKALQRRAEKIVRSRQLRVQFQSVPQRLFGCRHIAFLQLRSRDIHPTVRIRRIDLGHPREAANGTLQVALQQQPDAVIVPPFARCRTAADRDGWSRSL